MDVRNWPFFLRTICVSMILLFPAVSELYAQGPRYRDWGMDHMMDGRFWWFGGIFMILFWLLILLGIIALIRWLVQSGRTGNRLSSALPESALDVLKKRYAKGEITREQFEAMKRDIE